MTIYIYIYYRYYYRDKQVANTQAAITYNIFKNYLHQHLPYVHTDLQ